MFWYFKQNVDNWCMKLIKKIKRYFKREIKTASRWQQVTVNKWVIAIEPNHLTGDSF